MRSAEVAHRCGGSRDFFARAVSTRSRTRRRTKAVFPAPGGPTSKIEGGGTRATAFFSSSSSGASPTTAASFPRACIATQSSATAPRTGGGGVSSFLVVPLAARAASSGSQTRTYSSPSARKS
ncbi:MAG: hypothetical protein ACXWUG_27625 [Polyangiales bacterium]